MDQMPCIRDTEEKYEYESWPVFGGSDAFVAYSGLDGESSGVLILVWGRSFGQPSLSSCKYNRCWVRHGPGIGQPYEQKARKQEG
jgi:hypothetical protein